MSRLAVFSTTQQYLLVSIKCTPFTSPVQCKPSSLPSSSYYVIMTRRLANNNKYSQRYGFCHSIGNFWESVFVFGPSVRRPFSVVIERHPIISNDYPKQRTNVNHLECCGGGLSIFIFGQHYGALSLWGGRIYLGNVFFVVEILYEWNKLRKE